MNPLFRSPGDLDIMVDKRLDPKLERYIGGGKGGTYTNHSALERNNRRLAEASKYYILPGDRLVICPTHLFERLRDALVRAK